MGIGKSGNKRKVGWSFAVYLGDTSSPLQCISCIFSVFAEYVSPETFWSYIKYILLSTFWDLIKVYGTFAEKLLRTYWDFTEPFSETIRSLFWDLTESSWDYTESFWDFTESFLRLYGVFSQTVWSLFWDFTESFLRLYWDFSEILRNFSKTLRSLFWDFTESFLRDFMETKTKSYWDVSESSLSWVLLSTEHLQCCVLSINVYWDLTEFFWEFLCIYWVKTEH